MDSYINYTTSRCYERLVVLLLAVVLAAGCSGSLPEDSVPQQAVFFPAPPAQPRLQYLTRFSSSRDVSSKRSAFKRYVMGEEEDKPIIKPYGLSIAHNKIYICDTMLPGLEIIDLANRQFRYFTPAGEGRLIKPVNCDVDTQARLYVADTGRKQIVIFDSAGAYVTAFDCGANGKPTDVKIADGQIWVCDLGDHQIKVYDLQTHRLLRNFPEARPNTASYLYSPTNIDVRDGLVYVTDTGDARIKVFNGQGDFVKSIGSFGKQSGQFVRPKGLAVGRDSILYVVDAAFENVQMFNIGGALLTWFGGRYKGPGNLWLPAGLALDEAHLGYFQHYVHRDFKLLYLIFVASQYGPDKITVYGFIEPKASKTNL